MNIIFLRNNNPFANNSAAANRYRTLMEGLVSLGVNVKLYITDGYKLKQEKEQIRKRGEINGVEYEYLFTFQFSNYILVRLNKYVLKPGFARFKAWKIRKILKNEENGTIIWPSVSMEHLIALRKRIPGKTYFMESNEFPDIHMYNKGNILQRWVAGRDERFFHEITFHSLDGMALMTKTLLNYYSGSPRPKPKLLHLPMTVDLDRFDKPLPPVDGFYAPYIAFIGVMNDAKDGVNVLIEAFAKLTSAFPDIKLYLVGPRNYDTPNHKKIIRNFDLEKKVFWMGEYNRDTIPAIIKNADILVLPRPDSRQAQGGFPTKLGEYLASGKPVCATRVGELPDYLVDGESAFFSEPGQVDSFAESMKRALGNPENAKRVGLNGRKVAEKYFNKDVQAKILIDFLESL